QPWDELKEIQRILKARGGLFIRVPNGAFVKAMQRVYRAVKWEAVRERVRLLLAYTGMSAFPYQTGYTPAALRWILERNNFMQVRIHNQINLRGSDPERQSFWVIPEARRYLRRTHMASQLFYYLSLGRPIKGPWMEASCRRN